MHCYRLALDQIRNRLGMKILSYALVRSTGLLEPLKYSQKVQSAFWPSWLAQLHQARSIEQGKLFESKTITYLTHVCLIRISELTLKLK